MIEYHKRIGSDNLSRKMLRMASHFYTTGSVLSTGIRYRSYVSKLVTMGGDFEKT
jgi:hypothetical protein